MLEKITKTLLLAWQEIDRTLLCLALGITLWGIGLLFIASAPVSMKYTNLPTHFSFKQLQFFLISLVILIFFTLYPLKKMARFSFALYLFGLLLLLLTLIPGLGREVSGARRWLELGVISFQPSQFMKLPFLLFLAQLLERKQEKFGSAVHSALIPVGFLLLPLLLIALEPDLSTAGVYCLVGFFLLWVARVPLASFFGSLGLLLPFGIYLLQQKRYFIQRFSFLDPAADPFGKGYHLLRSLELFKEGGLTGLEGNELLGRLRYLPDSHTDFIFSVLAGKSGLIGAVALTAVFFFLIKRGLAIAKARSKTSEQLLAVGISGFFGCESALHLLVTTGLFPTTGMALPFVSFGGTALIMNFAMLGVLLQLSRPAGHRQAWKESVEEKLLPAYLPKN